MLLSTDYFTSKCICLLVLVIQRARTHARECSACHDLRPNLQDLVQDFSKDKKCDSTLQIQTKFKFGTIVVM